MSRLIIPNLFLLTGCQAVAALTGTTTTMLTIAVITAAILAGSAMAQDPKAFPTGFPGSLVMDYPCSALKSSALS